MDADSFTSAAAAAAAEAAAAAGVDADSCTSASAAATAAAVATASVSTEAAQQAMVVHVGDNSGAQMEGGQSGIQGCADNGNEITSHEDEMGSAGLLPSWTGAGDGGCRDGSGMGVCDVVSRGRSGSNASNASNGSTVTALTLLESPFLVGPFSF